MTGALQGALEFLQAAPTLSTLGELEARFTTLVQGVGFSHYSYTHIATPGQPFRPRLLFGRHSEAWNSHYTARRFAARDPALKAIFTNMQPFSWSEVQARAKTPADNLVFEEAREVGFGDGLVIPVHGVGGEVSGLMMTGERPDLTPSLRPTLHAAAIVFATTGAMLADFEQGPSSPRSLSERERECLIWAARGKSDWDIGAILALSPKTVGMHIDRARAKLNARTRMQALAVALKRGWLHADEL